MKPIAELIDVRRGSVSNEIFTRDVHEAELTRIFARCWLFVGHDSTIPQAHDYVTSVMGADSVIVQRDGAGKIAVFLNKCRHRGNEVCVYDEGNARSFTCSYHGWTYADGELTGVPRFREAYRDEIDRSRLGLVRVPRVATLGGLIFASWDADAVSLDDYLGDAKWYLENFLLNEDLGGLEVLAGVQRYRMPINWKLLAENFAGDSYHFASAHASLGQARESAADQRVSHFPQGRAEGADHDLSVAANYATGVPHGILDLKIGPSFDESDRREARELGPEAVAWLEERRRRLDERLKRYSAKPYSFHVANIFPNFALIGVGRALYGKGLILHHPAAPDMTEAWMWCAVDRNAPDAVKERQRFVLLQRQAAAGMVAPDDHENFQRIARNLQGSVARRYPFNYSMALGHDRDDPRPAELRTGEPWPGLILPQFSEVAQREFYRYWAELMARE